MAWDVLQGAVRMAKVLGGSKDQVKPVQEESFELSKPFTKTADQSVKQSKVQTTPNVNTDDAARRDSVPGYQEPSEASLENGQLDAQILQMQNKIEGLKRLKSAGINSIKSGTPKHSRHQQRVMSTDPQSGKAMYVD